jgi:phospholipid transport system substrate-binding protein
VWCTRAVSKALVSLRRFRLHACHVGASPPDVDEGERWMFAVCRRWLVIAVLGAVCASPAAALEAARAKSFLDDVAAKASTILAGGVPSGQRQAELQEVLQTAFDIEYIGRLVLGPTYRSLTDTQRRAYDDAFRRWVLSTYSRRIGDYGGEQIEILGAASAGAQDVKVESRVRGASIQEPVRIDWRVRERAEGLKIIDVEIEGVSMAISQRSEFASVVQQRGVDGLIAMLEERSGTAS